MYNSLGIKNQRSSEHKSQGSLDMNENVIYHSLISMEL
jgi:hypothetical protein